jgi:hypothetical protein
MGTRKEKKKNFRGCIPGNQRVWRIQMTQNAKQSERKESEITKAKRNLL